MFYACIIVKNGQTDVVGHSMSVFQILKKIGSQPPVCRELGSLNEFPDLN